MKQSCILFGGCLALTSLQAAAQKPNVLIIYTDDQGSLDLGCYGAPDLYTPNIDALANNGVSFSQFYGAPVSSASRAALLTGQFVKRAGITGNAGWIGLPIGKRTLAEGMRDSGYRTACIGKWHLGSWKEYTPNARGFDYFWGFLGGCIDSYSHFYYWGGPNMHDLWRNGEEIHREGRFFAEETLNEARQFMLDCKKDKDPFFVYWALNIPHYPLQPKQKWLDYYASLPNPRRMYAAFISTLDDYIGEMMTFLKAQGLLDNTLIIFQADNGHSTEVRTFGGGGWCGDYRGGKFSLFEGGIRVPAIVSWPGHVPQGEWRDQMACNVDWWPTISELCNLDLPSDSLDGRSLVPVINDAGAAAPHDVLHFDFNEQWAVREGDWKLIYKAIDVLPNDKNKTLEGFFLSNVKLDASERTNLADQYPEKVARLQKLRDEYLATLPEDVRNKK